MVGSMQNGTSLPEKVNPDIVPDFPRASFATASEAYELQVAL